MQCPIDHAELVMSERHGIEIDSCPECRGVWLDRNELDTIIRRSARWTDDPVFAGRDSRDGRDGRDGGRPPSQHLRPERKKKKRDFFSELFELGG